jgi:hypothetical protein
MGGFYNSFHVWGKTQVEVCELIKSLKNDDRGKCIVAPEANQWTAVYAEIGCGLPLAITISEQLQTAVLLVDVHDDDIFSYEFFKNGESVDEFNSCPDYFGTSSLQKDDINFDVFGQFSKERLDAFREQYGSQMKSIVESANVDFHQCKNEEEIKAWAKKLQESTDELYRKAGFYIPESNSVESNIEVISEEKIETNETEKNDLYIGHPECFAEFLNDPKDVSILAECLESTRNREEVFVSMPARDFCEVLQLTDAINSYDYLLEDDIPEGYVHIDK